MERFIGRFEVMDGAARRSGDTALRTHVASFLGEHFVSEREGRNLNVHMMHDEYGNPATANPLQQEEGSSGIRSSVGDRLDHGYASDESPASLNQLYAKSHAVGIRPRR